MKRRIAALSLALLMGLTMTVIPASASGRPWENAYAKAIRQQAAESWSIGVLVNVALVDLNHDGTPELLIGDMPGLAGISSIIYAATFENGALHPLEYKDYPLFNYNDHEYSDLIQYQNTSSGAYKIESVFKGLRNALNDHDDIVESYWISGNVLHIDEVFRKNEYYDWDTKNPTYSYYIEGQKVSASQYNAAFSSRNAGWTKVDDFQVVVDSLESGTTDGDIMAFLSKWRSNTTTKPTNAGRDKTASPTTHSMTVDGRRVSPAAYNIDGNNYFKLRDIAALLTGTSAQFQVAYNQQTQAINLTTGQSYTSVGGELAALPQGAQKVVPTPSAVYVNGKQVSFTAYNINGNNYFKLRDLGQTLGFSVDWNSASTTIVVETPKSDNNPKEISSGSAAPSSTEVTGGTNSTEWEPTSPAYDPQTDVQKPPVSIGGPLRAHCELIPGTPVIMGNVTGGTPPYQITFERITSDDDGHIVSSIETNTLFGQPINVYFVETETGQSFVIRLPDGVYKWGYTGEEYENFTYIITDANGDKTGRPMLFLAKIQ